MGTLMKYQEFRISYRYEVAFQRTARPPMCHKIEPFYEIITNSRTYKTFACHCPEIDYSHQLPQECEVGQKLIYIRHDNKCVIHK